MTAKPGIRIALIKLSSLGDVVHALPVAATLRARVPDAHLTWIVERREAAVLRDHPSLDALVAVDTRRWRHARTPRDFVDVVSAVRAMSRRLRVAAFDVALDLQGLLKSGVLAAATRAPLRIGFAARSTHCSPTAGSSRRPPRVTSSISTCRCSRRST